MGRARLADLMERHGVRPSRALGQNFLADPNTAERIVRLAGVGPGDRVVEIGAGLGSLTVALAGGDVDLIAVEMDRRLAHVLRTEAAPPGVRVVEGDALRLDWGAVLGPGSWRLVANLPYNVATPLVIGLLESVPAISDMLVMVQREVGERMAAGVGHPLYGAVSAKIAYWAEAEVAGRVPPTVFVPRPKVESALVRIVRRPVVAVGEEVRYSGLVELINAGFGQRRKMLRRSLAGVVPEGAFGAAGIDPTARAEDLDIQAWGRLAAATAGVSGRSVSAETPEGGVDG